MTYTAGGPETPAEHKAIGQYLQSLKPGNYLVEVKKNRPIRSLNANKYYHVIVNIIAIETGHTHEELHEALKMKFNSKKIFIERKEKGMTEAEQVAERLVPSMIIPGSTADLDTAEFASYINRIKHWAAEELHIIIPEAKDIDYKRWMEIENQYRDVFRG